jgi:hypothetical protein
LSLADYLSQPRTLTRALLRDASAATSSTSATACRQKIARMPFSKGLLAVAIASVLLTGGVVAQPAATVRLTSPLGRTGVSGTLRIVAQVVTAAPGGVAAGAFLRRRQAARRRPRWPPYFVEWNDENPTRRGTFVSKVDDAGGVILDKVRLEPLELNEETQVASVLWMRRSSIATAARSRR